MFISFEFQNLAFFMRETDVKRISFLLEILMLYEAFTRVADWIQNFLF